MSGSLKRGLTSPEERGAGKHPPRGGASKRHEGGFAEGDYGRGPTPYKLSHSGAHKNGQPLSVHEATAGRGGGGRIGKGDMHKNHSQDIEHPRSHAGFKAL